MDQRHIDELRAAKARQLDESRPDAVDWVHTAGRLTARERLVALLDPDDTDPAGGTIPYGSIAARDADGAWVPEAGGVDVIGTIAGQTVIASSTDFTDKGGGYGAARLERLFALAIERRWPVVFFVDGGGSRARHPRVAQGHRELNGPFGPFMLFDGIAELSGLVPTIAIVSGPAFAGHASLAGFSDFVVATGGSSIGMGGPPMVEAALGMSLTANELAGVEMHEVMGGIDLLVDDEPTAIAAARRYLSYWTAPARSDATGPAVSPAELVAELPEPAPAPWTPYHMETVIEALVDGGSFMELRPQFARSVITGFARVGGRSVGVIASRPFVNDGALDDNAATKAARMVQLCDAYELPILALIDTPGSIEADGRSRVNRWTMRPLMAHHHRTVALTAIQVGRGGGLGPVVLAGLAAGTTTPLAWWAWPSTRFGERDGFSGLRYPDAYDDILDPAETRGHLIRLLHRLPPPVAPAGKKHPVDTW